MWQLSYAYSQFYWHWYYVSFHMEYCSVSEGGGELHVYVKLLVLLASAVIVSRVVIRMFIVQSKVWERRYILRFACSSYLKKRQLRNDKNKHIWDTINRYMIGSKNKEFYKYVDFCDVTGNLTSYYTSDCHGNCTYSTAYNLSVNFNLNEFLYSCAFL